jgi:hypothetical protein
MNGAMAAMPDGALKKFFGLNKSALQNKDKGKVTAPSDSSMGGDATAAVSKQLGLPKGASFQAQDGGTPGIAGKERGTMPVTLKPTATGPSTDTVGTAIKQLPGTPAKGQVAAKPIDTLGQPLKKKLPPLWKKEAKKKKLKEEPVGGQAPAVPMGAQQTQVPQGTQQARKANVTQFNQMDLDTKLSQLPMMLNYDTAISTLADIVSDKASDLVKLRKVLESEINSSPLDATQKKSLGNLLGVLTAVGNQRTQMASKSLGAKPGLKEVQSKKKVLREEPEESGLESSTADQEGDMQKAKGNESEEALAFSKSMKGHTIRDSFIEMKPDGGLINIQLVSVEAPAEIAWNNNGKVVFSFKGRPYIIRK